MKITCISILIMKTSRRNYENNFIYNCTENKKHIGINLIKRMKELHGENYTLLKEVK